MTIVHCSSRPRPYWLVTVLTLGGLSTAIGAVAQDSPDLYSTSILRTIELRFDSEAFMAQIEEVSNTTEDGYVAATMIVDDLEYAGVGVRFRGNSSQRDAGDKRSFKIKVNWTDPEQRLHGYRTLKLNNSAGDPTFLREVLFSRTTHQYFPSPTANHVKLVLNEQNWGVYVNVQQFNKDFLREWFDRTSGNRWKAPSGAGTDGSTDGGVPGGGGRPPGGGGFPGGGSRGDTGLTWLGSDTAPYEAAYELKSDQREDPWGELVAVCDELNNTPDDKLEDVLARILAIDDLLWMIVLENAFGDLDGYIFKGADYAIYQEPSFGRIYGIQHDGGEVMQFPEDFEILEASTDENRPVVQQLLSIPHLRARYLAHVRTLLDETFNWETLGPIALDLRDRIAGEVAADTKKLYSTEFFVENFTSTVILEGEPPFGGAIAGLQEFIEQRRAFLLASPELDGEVPEIVDVSLDIEGPDGGPTAVLAGDSVVVVVCVEPDPAGSVWLHHTGEPDAPFTSVELSADESGGAYVGEIPAYPGGSEVRYYVEARGNAATSFFPSRGERSALSYHVTVSTAESTPVVINELMASNDSVAADPQGEFDDWIELLNLTESEVDLSGFFVSDRADNPRKWRFPDGTAIAAHGYLVVWLDEDGGDEPGLHANFKLSSAGERLLLVDRDDHDNKILDSVEFGPQPPDIAWARLPDGDGEFAAATASPGRENGSDVSAPRFVRGDTNLDGAVDMSDAIATLSALFLGGDEMKCPDAGDANDDGAVDISDAVATLFAVFLGQGSIPPPGSECGTDATQDALACESTAEHCR